MKKNNIIVFMLALFGLSISTTNAQTWNVGTPTATDLTATLSGGTLTISGTGAMQNFGTSSGPWYSYREQITALVINSGITRIGSWAFLELSRIPGSVIIPNSVTSIGESAFRECEAMTSVTIGSGVTSLGWTAFDFCRGLTSVTALMATPPTILSTTFSDMATGAPLYVPAASVALYQAANGWSRLSARTVSSVADLASMTVSQGTLSPAFTPAAVGYSVSVAYNVSSITLSATFANQFASIAAGTLGSKTLNVGQNTFYITVTAQDGITIKTYTVTVTRAAPSTNANLASIGVSQGSLSPAFSAGITSYSVSVANDIASITLSATTTESTATITAGALGTKALNIGANAFYIEVTAQDGITNKVYTVTITRAPSTNANLASLSVSEGVLSPTFAAATTAYSVTVAYLTPSITLSATTAESTATISAGTLGSKALNVGANSFSITVTAPDGVTTKTYTVTVTRTAPSTNANLATLSVSVGTLSPTFDGDTIAYSVNVAYTISSITFSGTTADPYATIAAGALGTRVLTVGTNNFPITATASDGATTKTYIIKVIRNGMTWQIGTPTATDMIATLSTDTLTISGTGAMQNFTSGNAPWYSERANITTLVINSGPTSIGSYAFYNCNALLGALTIPNTVTKIENHAFQNCSGFSGDLIIPNSITFIGEGSLQNCNHFTGNLTIPNTVTTIEGWAFYQCTGFTDNLVIGNSVTAIGESAFQGCTGFTGKLTIPASITVIGGYAFNNCRNLTSVTALRATPISINANVFGNVTISTIPLYVPAGSVALYQGTNVWKDFAPITAASAIADLASLTVSAGTLSPAFHADTTAYTVSVTNDVDSITLTATVANQYANITAGLWGTTSLIVGQNLFAITVTAQDEVTTKTYTVVVIRLSTNANLASLTVSAGTLSPAFHADTTQYAVTVAHNVDSIALVATTDHPYATIAATALGTKALSVGINTIPIIVTAEDGISTKTYTVVVSRSTAIDNINASTQTITIYPNPVTDQLRIKNYETKLDGSQLRGSDKVEIYNMQGVLMGSYRLEDDTTIIDVSALSAGVYFVKIYTINDSIIKKFVKNKGFCIIL